MNNSYNTGIKGEQIACSYLQKEYGMQLLHSRYKTRFGEIDLIMQDKNYTVFVEVKYRKNACIGDGLISVNSKKLKKLNLAMQEYIAEKQLDCEVRFDVIEIVSNKINYIQNAIFA